MLRAMLVISSDKRGRWAGCIQRVDASGLHPGDVGKPALARGLRVRDRAGIEEHQTLDALRLPSNEFEGKVAPERQADQREARWHVGKQLDRHCTQRRQVTKREHATVVCRAQCGHLMREQPLVREMGAGEDECRSGLHGRTGCPR